MITGVSGATSSSLGSAVSPSITGISMSSTMMSTGRRRSVSIAILPSATDAATRIPGSASSTRESSPRTTALSSTSITRIASPSDDDAAREVGAGDGGRAGRSAIAGRAPKGGRPAQMSPTWANLVSMMSLSNGFMMYSFAPALSAS